MKKLFAIIVSVVMVFASMTLFACDSTFSGNYKEATAEETQTFVNKVMEAQASNPALGIIAGMDLETKIIVSGKEDGKDVDATIKAEAKSTVTEDKAFNLSAKAEISATGNKMIEAYNGKYEVYAAGGKVYLKMAQDNKDEIKISMDMKLDDILGMANMDSVGYMTGGMDLDIDEYFEYLEDIKSTQEYFGADAIKFYLDSKDGSHKLKIEFNVVNKADIDELKGELYLAFDENYAFKGIKADLSLKEDDVKAEIFVSLKSYDGSVKLPSESELEKYTSGNLFGLFA